MVRFGRDKSSLVDFFEKEEDVTEEDEKVEDKDATDQRT